MKLNPFLAAAIGVMLILIAVAAFLIAAGSNGGVKLVIASYGVIETSAWGLLAAGFLGGMLLTALVTFFTLRDFDPMIIDDRALSRLTLNAVAGAAILALFVVTDWAVRAGKTGGLERKDAALVLLFGAGSLMALIPAIDLFQRGGGIEFESRWGGLGGGLGGWRLSPAAILTLIALVFALAAGGVVHPPSLKGGNTTDGASSDSKPGTQQRGGAEPPRSQRSA